MKVAPSGCSHLTDDLLNRVNNICKFGKSMSLMTSVSGHALTSQTINMLVAAIKYCTSLLSARQAGTVTFGLIDFDKKKIFVKNVAQFIQSAMKLLKNRLSGNAYFMFLLKYIPYLQLTLDAIEVIWNYKKFLPGGITKNNILNLCFLATYHVLARLICSYCNLLSAVAPIALQVQVLNHMRNALWARDLGDLSDLLTSAENLFFPTEMTAVKAKYLQLIGLSMCETVLGTSQNTNNFLLRILLSSMEQT